MFAMVVLFGLIHGLVLLPICLSLVGPLPPSALDDEKKKKGNNVELSNGNNGHIRDEFMSRVDLIRVRAETDFITVSLKTAKYELGE